jgi:hypothetical protein
MRNAQKWRRIVLLANANDSDDSELASHLRAMMLHNFAIPIDAPGGLPVGEDPGYIASLAATARRFLPELRDLLLGLGESATRAQLRAAMGVLRRHEHHLKDNWERTPPALVAATKLLDLRTGKYRREFRGRTRRELACKSKRVEYRELNQTPKYCDPLDPIIHRMILEPQLDLLPVRACKRAACGKFFVRSGRRLFCSARCKQARWRPKYQMSRTERRDYQLEYRARLLQPPALRKWIQKLARRRMAPARRRRMLTVLRRVLRLTFT